MKLLLTVLIALSLQSPAATAGGDVWASLMTEVSRLSTKGEFRAAVPLAMQAVEEARRSVDGDERLADSLNGLGFLLCQTGEYLRAEKALREALALSSRLPGSQHRTAMTLDRLSILYQATQGHTAELEALRRKALAMAVDSFGPKAPEVGMLLSRLAGVLTERGKLDEAAAILEGALQLADERSVPALRADMYLIVGAVAYRKRQYAAALDAYGHAGRLYARVAGPDCAGRVPELVGIAAVYSKTKREGEADRALAEAERIASRVWGSEHQILARILVSRSEVLKKLGKREEAKQAGERAREIYAMRRVEANAVNAKVDASFLGR